MRNKMLAIGVVGLVIGVLLSTAVVLAGNLNPSAGSSGAASQMFTLQQMYDRLVSGAAGSKMTAFTEPGSGPSVATGRTLDEIMAVAPAVNATGATAAEVASGKSFWGLNSGEWGQRTGSAAAGSNVSGGNGSKTFAIPDGFYSGTKTATANDGNLLTSNIKSGVTIFGVAGSLAAAGVPKTGAGIISGYTLEAGEDGSLQKGVVWPSPRFTDNANGTVTDNLTGLIWLKNANCAATTRDWATALSDVATLNSGGTSGGTMNSANCDDTSNSSSHQTDWRLPNLREMQSLVHYGFSSPAIPNTAGTVKWTEGAPFTGVQSYLCWTSTTFAGNTSSAWFVDLNGGFVSVVDKANAGYVWPVRGGQ